MRWYRVMWHRWLCGLLAVIVVASACSSSDQRAWAAEAQAWHDGLREAQIAQGGGAYARFLAPDVVWDDSAPYAEEAEGFPSLGEEAIDFAARVLGPESLLLEPDIFISVDGLVDFWFYDWAPLGNDFRPDTKEPAHGVSLMAPIGSLGAESFINGTAIEDWRDRRPGWPQADETEAVATSWTQVWSGTADGVGSLYHSDARLRDTIGGIDLTGRDAIADLARAAGQWEITTVGRDAVRGVYPLVRGRGGSGKILEEVVLVVSGQDENGCAGEMVVWLRLDGGLVAEETRYWPIERARRCLPADDLPDGWWTDRPIPADPTTIQPTEDIETPTEALVVGDATITVYNGTPALNRLVAWGLTRFETAELTPPTVASVTFTLYSGDCDDLRARYRATPAGAELVFCFDEETACWDDNCDNFTPGSRSLILHELAHAWMRDTIDENVEQRFIDHTGLEVWTDPRVPWDQRSIEHAAEAMTWGLMDRDIVMVRLGYPSSDRLANGFRILTGTDPLPRTDEYLPTQPTTPDE
ncbi:MAG: hypothetical protein OEV40_13135 [Acidimicrobiia bacterium]|nr:hypothetical protein [Acidimicrobiia bacterium]